MNSSLAKTLVPGELVARLEAASVGSPTLDGEIHRALFPDDLIMTDGGGAGPKARPAVREPIGSLPHLPGDVISDCMGVSRYTTSLDAALALAERVLPGWMVVNLCEWEHDILRAKGPWHANLKPLGTQDRFDVIGGRCPNAATPALALCIAILKARTAAETGAVGEAGE